VTGQTLRRKFRVLLVDDHAVVCEGLAAVLSRSESVEVVGQAGSADEAISRAEACRPDVIVMDIRMPGREASRASSRPGSRKRAGARCGATPGARE
jgi:DNA-binding NarL/FixJ family response regulator